jgi:hypothetical protein
MFYDKHRETIDEFGLTTLYLNHLARTSLNSMRWDSRRARALCGASLRRRPWQAEPYRLLLRSFIPRSWFLAGRTVIRALPR